jgi:DNA-binding MarR family transcriptional regulator
MLTGNQDVLIKLTDEQIDQVIREAPRGRSRAALLTKVSELQELRSTLLPLLDRAEYSRATLRALLVLGAFPPDGSERELRRVAKELRMSPSATHRHIRTWVAVGLLVQDPESRRYRRIVSADAGCRVTATSRASRDAT